jgi:hypothetical protein
MNQIDVRIQFFKVGFFTDKDGQFTKRSIPQVFRYVRDQLRPRTEEPSRYMTLGNDNQLIMEVVEIANGVIRGRFGVKRRRGLPRVEDAGVYSDLQLAATAGLAEIRHFVVYPRKKLLGIEVNGNAPGISRWAQYLQYKVPDLDWVSTEIILAGTAAETLKRVGRIAGATLTVYAESSETLGDLDGGLKSGLRSLKKSADNARKITVAFELGTRKRDESLELRFRKKLPGFLQKAESRQALSDLTIRAYDEAASRTRDIDLLEDRFVGFRKVAALDSAGRVIDSDSIFAQIDDVAKGLPEGVGN